LQDAARLLGIGPSTMTKWVAAEFVRVGYPYYTQLPLVSSGEVERVRAAMAELEDAAWPP